MYGTTFAFYVLFLKLGERSIYILLGVGHLRKVEYQVVRVFCVYCARAARSRWGNFGHVGLLLHE